MEFGTDIRSAERIHCHDFGDPQAFPHGPHFLSFWEISVLEVLVQNSCIIQVSQRMKPEDEPLTFLPPLG